MATKKKTRFGFKRYFQPTPKRVRIFGDSLAAASTLGASISVLNGQPLVGTIMLIAGWVGKFVSNFFGEVNDGEHGDCPKQDKEEKGKP